MKIREISLVAFGAITAVSVIAAASVIFYTPKTQAQASSAAPAPGGVSMIVSPASLGTGSSGNVQGGTIITQDSINRVIKVAPYAIFTPAVAGTAPSVAVGTASTYSY